MTVWTNVDLMRHQAARPAQSGIFSYLKCISCGDCVRNVGSKNRNKNVSI